jgi:hypothetical protein
MTRIEEAKALLGGRFENFLQFSTYVYRSYTDTLKKDFKTNFKNSSRDQRLTCCEMLRDNTIVPKLKSSLYQDPTLLINTVMNIMYDNRGRCNKHLLFNMFKEIKEFEFAGYWDRGTYKAVN